MSIWNGVTHDGFKIPIYLTSGADVEIDYAPIDGPGTPDVPNYLAVVLSPEGEIHAGDGKVDVRMIFDSDECWSCLDGNQLLSVVCHELGHVLGLGHTPCFSEGCIMTLMNCQVTCEPMCVFPGQMEVPTLQCLYGDLEESTRDQRLNGYVNVAVEEPQGNQRRVKLKKGTCRGCIRTCVAGPALSGQAQAGTRTYELAVSSAGRPSEVFANLTDADWTDDVYSQFLPDTLPNATFQIRVFNQGVLEWVAQSYPTVDIIPTTTGVKDSPGLQAMMLSVHPNPSRGEIAVAFTLQGGEPATVELFDLGGRRIASLEGVRGPGRSVVSLLAGSRIAPGAYLVVVTQGGRRRATKAIRLE